MVVRLEETLIDCPLKKGQEVIVVAGCVHQDARFGVNSQLSPGEDFKKFIERSETTGQGDKGICFLGH